MKNALVVAAHAALGIGDDNAPAHTTWLNTYFPDANDKKIRRKR